MWHDVQLLRLDGRVRGVYAVLRVLRVLQRYGMHFDYPIRRSGLACITIRMRSRHSLPVVTHANDERREVAFAALHERAAPVNTRYLGRPYAVGVGNVFERPETHARVP